jgi:hypothetical protein
MKRRAFLKGLGALTGAAAAGGAAKATQSEPSDLERLRQENEELKAQLAQAETEINEDLEDELEQWQANSEEILRNTVVDEEWSHPRGVHHFLLRGRDPKLDKALQKIQIGSIQVSEAQPEYDTILESSARGTRKVRVPFYRGPTTVRIEAIVPPTAEVAHDVLQALLRNAGQDFVEPTSTYGVDLYADYNGYDGAENSSRSWTQRYRGFISRVDVDYGPDRTHLSMEMVVNDSVNWAGGDP